MRSEFQERSHMIPDQGRWEVTKAFLVTEVYTSSSSFFLRLVHNCWTTSPLRCLIGISNLTCLSNNWGFLGGSVIKNLPANAGDDGGSVPGWGRASARGNGNPLQYFCLGNPMDRGGCQATVHGVAKGWTRLSMHTQSINEDLTPFLSKSSFISGENLHSTS